MRQWPFRIALAAAALATIGIALNLIALWWLGLAIVIVAFICEVVANDWESIKAEIDSLRDV
jgi:hypothetical protein